MTERPTWLCPRSHTPRCTCICTGETRHRYKASLDNQPFEKFKASAETFSPLYSAFEQLETYIAHNVCESFLSLMLAVPCRTFQQWLADPKKALSCALQASEFGLCHQQVQSERTGTICQSVESQCRAGIFTRPEAFPSRHSFSKFKPQISCTGSGLAGHQILWWTFILIPVYISSRDQEITNQGSCRHLQD